VWLSHHIPWFYKAMCLTWTLITSPTEGGQMKNSSGNALTMFWFFFSRAEDRTQGLALAKSQTPWFFFILMYKLHQERLLLHRRMKCARSARSTDTYLECYYWINPYNSPASPPCSFVLSRSVHSLLLILETADQSLLSSLDSLRMSEMKSHRLSPFMSGFFQWT